MKTLRVLLGGATSVGFLGLGKTNLSLIRALGQDVRITLRSDSPICRGSLPSDLRIDRILDGSDALSCIDEDVLLLSPSVRRDRAELMLAEERGIHLVSDAELFFDAVCAPVLAVTGSSGKSTVSTMAHAMLVGGGVRSVLCGNIGVPMVNAIDPQAAVYVTELSSFMLAYHKKAVRRCAITNVTPNHLDWHKSFAEYAEAKLSLIRLSDECVVSADDEYLRHRLGHQRAFARFSTKLKLCQLTDSQPADVYMTLDNGYICRNGERLIHSSELKRREEYNIRNAMCALALTEGFSGTDSRLEALRCFNGLSHRAELVASYGGVDYIDSSIDTTPERCAETLHALGRRVVLLLGGRGKGLSYYPLIEPIRKYARLVIAFGEEGQSISDAISSAAEVVAVKGLSDAVALAVQNAMRGDAVLLSPACTSYDEFTCFEERGIVFKGLVDELAGQLS